ncbi:YLP motif-containing protein 1 [Hyla sarda]|uniref:YLP motif-containing protein 1 n=1 Tax=Hyla sarda TaxID=327740 RepID=UPI0024C317F4|nr:YLP motif-containing protein 1 [Hyla sarda]
MFPGWPPRYSGPAAPAAPTAPPPAPAFQSLRDQHLAQLEQLQRMHQRQLESVLPAGPPVASAPPPPRPYYAPPRPPAAYSFPPPPYGHSVPPPDYQQPPPPPEPEQPPPPPAPDQQPPPPSEDGTERTSSDLEEQQQYYYKQHLLSLQQKSKKRVTEASDPDPVHSVPQTSVGHAPPLPSQEPPPVDKVPPPGQDTTPGLTLTEDPEQAQRLKTLQEAAAHWQQHEQHRLGFQYQGIIQKHSALQQLLQRYQQLVVEPPHLAALSVEVQLQHYEVQQKQLVPLLQEWENQFKKWQELLQTYPHKDQLQDYHVQWTSWQAHMKSSKTQLKEKVASLKSLKQQYGGNHYIAVVPQYPQYSPVLPPSVPAVAPLGITVPPPYPAPGPPMYSTVPPPPLPTAPATSYPEAAPPLPPASAPPLPPVTSAPPPPPPASADSVEAVPPPLPPSSESSYEAAAAALPSSHTIPPAEVPTTSPQIVAPSGAVSASAVAVDKALPPGLTYQAQQALLKNAKATSYTPLSQSAPPLPTCLPESPTTDQSLEKCPEPKEDSKLSILSSGLSTAQEKENAPPVPPMGHQQNTAGPRFPGPGRGSQTFHAPRGQFDGSQGSLGFRGPRPFLDGKHFQGPGVRSNAFMGQNQHFTKEQHESAVKLGEGDTSTHSLEAGLQTQTPDKQQWERGGENKWEKGELPGKKWDQQHVPANRWDQVEETSHHMWDRPSGPPERSWDNAGRNKWDAKGSRFSNRSGRFDGPPQENTDIVESHKCNPDSQTDHPGLDRTEALPGDMRNKQEGSQFNRLDSQRDPMGHTWGDNWSDSQHDRWGGPDRGPQDRWGTTEKAPEHFGDAGGPGLDRVRNREGPPLDRFNVHEVPFHAPNRFRFGAPEMPPRGRARFPGGPPRGRFAGPEGYNRDRFDNPEGLASDRFGGPEGGNRDQLSNPEDRPRDLFEGPNFPPSRNRFGGPQPPPERFRGPDLDQFGHDGGPRDDWGLSEEQERFDNSQDSWVGNRAPFNKGAGKPDWHPEGDMMERGPPLPVEAPVNKELHVDERWKGMAGEQWGKFNFGPEDPKSRHTLTHDSPAHKETSPDVTLKTNMQSAPKTLSGTFHSRFQTGNQMFKAPSADVGKTDVEMEDIKTSHEGHLNKDSQSIVSVAPPQVRPASPTSKRAPDTTDSRLPKPHSVPSEGNDLTGADKKMDSRAEAAGPVKSSSLLSGPKEPTGSLKVPPDDTKLPDSETPKPNVPQVPMAKMTVQTTPVKPEEIKVSSHGSSDTQPPPTAKNDLSTFSSQSSAKPAPAIRPGAPHVSTPVMFGTLQTAPPVRPVAPHVAPFKPGLLQGGVPVRPGAPRGFPPLRPGVPRASPHVRPGAPRPPLPPRPGAPWASPSIRQGIPQAATPVRPGLVRGARPVRPGAPRMPPPIRPTDFQTPFSDEEFNEEVPPNEDNVYEQPMGADPMAQPFYKGNDFGKSMNEPQVLSDHDPIVERKQISRIPCPDGHHGPMRQNFPDQDFDSVESHSHHETARQGSFREYEMSEEPDYNADDFPSQGPRRGNFDPRFHHPSRGRSRGFVRDRLPPRPGTRDIMEVPSDRSFEPRDPFLEERPPFRDGPEDHPPYDREAFRGESRFLERERFLDPLLDDRRRDLPGEGPRSENWERDRYWRDRDPEFARDPYFREDRLPLPIPPMPRDLDGRHDPWLRERSIEREGYFDRAERRYIFDADVGRDFPRIPDDLDLPLRERDWLPPRRSLSPHRPFSPVHSRPPLPPLPPLEEYLNDRWRLDRELADRDFRERVELRIREYPDVPLWHDRKRNEYLENPGLEPRDDRWFKSERVMEEGRNMLPLQPSVAPELLGLPTQSAVPESEPVSQGVVALSQRQHEIILKAAQELKMLREQKEQLDNLKNFFSDNNPSNPLKAAADPQSVALQRPPDALEKEKAGSMGGRGPAEHWDEDSFSGLWDEERQAAHSANLPIGSKMPGIQQTVDYGHGRDITVGKVEQTPYGERVVLLPESTLDRGIPSFPKDYLIDCYDRDLRDRDPYFERPSSKHPDRRVYERERDRDRSDSHRERGDHDRERFDRDRHSRDER